MNQDKVIILRTYNTLLEANLAKETLEQNGVACFLSNELVNQIFYPMYGPGVSGINLNIFEKDIERANDILSELK